MGKNKYVYNDNFGDSMKSLSDEEKMSSPIPVVVNLHSRVQTELNTSACGLSKAGAAPLQKCCGFTSRATSACFTPKAIQECEGVGDMEVTSVRFQRSCESPGISPKWGVERQPMEVSSFHAVPIHCCLSAYSMCISVIPGALSGCLCIRC